MNKKISVILPVYNSQDYIQDTIKSVLKQTYKNFELIVVNDGSTDNTHSICEKLSQKDKRIKYFSKENGGVSDTRNFALIHASGEYVTFIDSDDLYEKDYLEVLIMNIEKYNADLITCAYKTLSNNSKIIDCCEEFLDCNFKDYIEKLQPNFLFNQLWNKMFKMNIIRKNNLSFDTALDLGEDYKFNLEYIMLSNKQIYINESLYNYRITTNGLGFKYRKNSSEIKFYLLKKLEDIYIENNYDMNYIYKNYLIQYIAYFSNIVDVKNDDSKKIKLKRIENVIKSLEYRDKIKIIKYNSNLKFNFICNILLVKNKYIIYYLGKMANIYDKFNKKKKCIQ